MRVPAITDDSPRAHDPVENRPLVPYTPSATGGAVPRSPVSVVTLPTGGGHMASGEGDGVRDGERVRVRVGEARVRDGDGVRVRDGDGLHVWDGVRDTGMDSDTGRHGSATPPDEYDAGTMDWPK
jgi:hypothetical protein